MLSDEPPRLDDAASPPPLPPVLPPLEAPPVMSPVQAALLQGRLHPLTLVMFLFNAVRNFLIPALIVLFTGSQRTLGVMLLLFLGLGLVQTLIRYFTFTYRIENGELITRQGVLERTERHIPLARVQDVRFEQGVMHRVLKVVDVHVETAGGRGAEASLSVLSKTEAENLRRAVFEQARVRAREAGVAPAAAIEAAPTEIIRKLSTRELVLAGLTSNRTASALAIILVAWQLLDDVLPKNVYERFAAFLGSFIESSVNAGDHPNWVGILVLAVAVILFGMVLSAAGSVVLFHGFTLSRRGEDLHRSYGLLTRRASSLPRRRIQLLKIEETALRRLLRLATLRADTAGSRPTNQEQRGNEGRDVLLPAVRREEIETLLPVFFPDLDAAAPDWRRVSRRAIRRGTLKGALVCVLLTGVTLPLEQDLFALWPLALIPAVYALNAVGFRHLGFALGQNFFRMRRGWLSRVASVVPIRNAQTIVVRQTPFDRRHRVATLMVDTAGQAYTGGSARIRNVPEAEALAVARTLAHRAARTRYRW